MDVIKEFIVVVRKYIKLMDSVPNVPSDRFLNECNILLPQVYYLGHSLLDVFADEILNVEESQEQRDSVFKESRALFERLRIYMGNDDKYEQVFDPFSSKAVSEGSIADDLADIYGDLKSQLIEYESGVDLRKKAALWEWKFTMQKHAGKHIVDVLWAIHHVLFSPR